MKGRDDRNKTYGFAAELGDAGAASAEDDIDFDTVSVNALSECFFFYL